MIKNSSFAYEWHHQMYVPHFVVCAGLCKLALNFSLILLKPSKRFRFGYEIIALKLHEMYTSGIF
jgi:hypothetical protein